MNKKTIIAAAVVAFALVAGLVYRQFRAPAHTVSTAPISMPTIDAPTAPPSNAAIVITDLEGEVSVLRDGASSTARMRMELKEGDEVNVGDDGSLTVTYPDFGRTLVASGTHFVIRKAETNEAHDSLIVNLKLDAGRVWSRFERLFGPKDSFDVRASSVVADVRGTSFGVSLDGPRIAIQVADHVVKVREVRDREPSDDERARGVQGLDLEAFTGLESDVHENEEVAIDLVAGVSMESMFQPRALPPEALQDPFVIQGNLEQTPEDLRVEPIFGSFNGTFDIGVFMQWIQELAIQYPDGNVPTDVIIQFYRDHGYPMDEAAMRAAIDPSSREAYLRSLGITDVPAQ